MNNLPVKKIVVIDIDGTIADLDHRLHFLSNPSEGVTDGDKWEKFFQACDKDEPILDMIDFVNRIAYSGKALVFCTGRPERTRTKTIQWLDEYIPYPYELLMRPDKDFGQDGPLKIRMLSEKGYGPEKVLFVLDDRDQVVRAMRDFGYRVLQVRDGEY